MFAGRVAGQVQPHKFCAEGCSNEEFQGPTRKKCDKPTASEPDTRRCMDTATFHTPQSAVNLGRKVPVDLGQLFQMGSGGSIEQFE